MGDATLTDCEVICQGYKFRTHRLIMARYSDVFRAAFSNQMKEGRTGIIDLTVDDIPVVTRLWSYFYRGEYDGEWKDGVDKWVDDEMVENDQPDQVNWKRKRSATQESNNADYLILSPPAEAVYKYRCRSCRKSGETIVHHAGCTSRDRSSKDQAFKQLIPGSLMLNVRMYETADKYNMVDLQDLAVKKFKGCLKAMDGQCFPEAEIDWVIRRVWQPSFPDEDYDFQSLIMERFHCTSLETEAVRHRLFSSDFFMDICKDLPQFTYDILNNTVSYECRAGL